MLKIFHLLVFGGFMKYSTLLCLTSLAFLGACNSSNDSSSGETNPATEASPMIQTNTKASRFEVKYLGPKTKLENDFSNIDKFAEDINTHLLDIKTIDGTLKQGQVYCSKTSAGEFNTNQYAQFSSNGQTAKLALSLNSNDPAKVRFICRIQDEDGNTIHQFDQHLKKNIVINSKESVAAIGQTEVDTLLILDEGELITEGTNFSLKINNLVSYKGTISTYDLKTVRSTPELRDGNSGGEIYLTINKAQGDLTINLRGTNGGEQIYKPTRPAPQPNAVNGRCNRNGNGCDGQNGLKGLPANDGADGLKGGDSGQAIVRIEEKSDFEVVYNIQPGKGSKGVPASLPGAGGKGGEADSVFIYVQCPTGPQFSPLDASSMNCGSYTVNGKRGQDGAPGAAGRDGLDGHDGAIKTSQFIHSEEGIHEMIQSSWSNFRGNL
jgi:hypothetical protein